MQVKMRMLGNTNLIKVFSIAILAACSIQAGIPLDPDNLDQAWLAALALAHEAGMNHGRDIVFTYGPLGYTHPYQAYLPSTFSSYITGHLLVTAIQCIVIACAAASAHVGVFLSAVFAVAVAQSLVKTDLLFYLALYSSAVLLIRGLDASLTRWNLLTLILIGLNLAIASLYKFTGLAISLLIFPLCFASFGRLIPPRGLKVSVATYIFAFISIWSGLGGKIATIPAYISNSMEISSNYDAAMALAGRTRDTVLGVAALLVYAVILALSSYRSRWAASRTIPLATLLFGIAFIVWKAAYVRQDDGHLLLFPMFIGWAGCFAHLGFSSVRHLDCSKGSALRSIRLQIAFAIASMSWWLVIYLGLIDSPARFITAFLADHKQNAELLLGGRMLPNKSQS